MADAVLSFALEQLATFLRQESALLGALQDEVQHITDELGQMRGFLRGAESILEDNPNLKEWVSQVRDTAYNAEDVLDEFILRFGKHHGDGFLGQVRKIFNSIKHLKARHQLATKLHTIKDRIKNISDAHQRYQNQYGNIDQGSGSVVVVQNPKKNTWHNSRGDALLKEEDDLVGIERSKKKLIDMLPTSDRPLHAVAVVGMGGLGKTTLVKKVYDDANLKNQYKYHLWITVSQTFKIEELLVNAIRQLFEELKQPEPNELDKMDIISLKQRVRDMLHQEKFIVVFDDVWKATDWDALRVAFPSNSCGSTIIVTTRIDEVGQAATSDISGEVYLLERLSPEESWNLFCKKVFQANSCPAQFEKISRNIIERCAGLPLAIVVIGGVLATKNQEMEKWDLFSRSLSEQLADNDQLSNMIKILSLSYFDLPDHLRTCILYLSILPEDVSINKNRLLRLWIAEGFVQEKNGMTIEEVAETYLYELINRSLVQISLRDTDGRVILCSLHDMILQFIIRKAQEHGITTIYREQMTRSSNKVRRLVIHDSSGDTQVSHGLLKCLRSLVLSESTASISEPFLSKLLYDNCGLLTVLDLEGASLEVIPNEIFKFLQLKYLGLRKTGVKTVPKLIRKLQKLETLDLRRTKVEMLPVEILKLQQLRHLLMGGQFDKEKGIQFAQKISNLKCLQSLGMVDADQIGDINIVKEIGKLTQLRKLRIDNLRREDGKELCSSIEKLTNLRSLWLESSSIEEGMDLAYPISSTPKFLHTLKLRGKLEKLPQWIVSLHGLTKISIHNEVRDDPFPLMEDLPNLMELVLLKAYTGVELCFKVGKFQKLKLLHLLGLQALRWIRVEKGALPFFEELRLGHCFLLEELPEGVEHLKCLQKLFIFGMLDRFIKNVEDMKNEKKKIDHISCIDIFEYVDGKYEKRLI